MTRPSRRGRPAATTLAEIEGVALRLFAERGFEATTVAMIADELGLSARTVRRYFPSKNDIAWGQFDQNLDEFAASLAAMDPAIPIWEAVHRAVLAFNDFPASEQASLRRRMHLILSTPSLEAHSTLRYAQWRAVVAAYVAHRTGTAEEGLYAQTAAHITLGIAVASYSAWLAEPEAQADLGTLLDDALRGLREYLSV